MQIAPGLERRLRVAETRGAEVVREAVRSEADERLAEALAGMPRPVLHRMLALADTVGDDATAAMLEADAELVVWIEKLRGEA